MVVVELERRATLSDAVSDSLRTRRRRGGGDAHCTGGSLFSDN